VAPKGKKATGTKAVAAERKAKPTSTKLTYKETLELAGLPGNIESMEGKLAELHDAMARPNYYQQPGETIAADQGQVKELEESLKNAYERWAELGDRE